MDATEKTGIARAIERFGGVAALARALGESTQTVSNWRQRGEPPANRCVAIEQITGVSRRELRSDWADYWPEAPEATVEQKAA
jgi:DNA-binding transcriptional regulator YdaS (Cro superfamily)